MRFALKMVLKVMMFMRWHECKMSASKLGKGNIKFPSTTKIIVYTYLWSTPIISLLPNLTSALSLSLSGHLRSHASERIREIDGLENSLPSFLPSSSLTSSKTDGFWHETTTGPQDLPRK